MAPFICRAMSKGIKHMSAAFMKVIKRHFTDKIYDAIFKQAVQTLDNANYPKEVMFEMLR